jgi:gluconolactonase
MSETIFIADSAFESFVSPDAQIRRVHTGMRWAEGPCYLPSQQCVVYSDIPNNRMYCYHEEAGVSVFRAPSRFSNGNTVDTEGRLVTCEHGSRGVSRTEADGSVTALVDRYEGKRLNSPNDAAVRRDGTIWFTDPTYGIRTNKEGYQSEQELSGQFVFRFDPATGELSVVADDFIMPNGIAFSPDETLLYVGDSGTRPDGTDPSHIRVFQVADGRRLEAGREFVVVGPGHPDGFRLDVDGNLWTSAGDGVHCYAPDGKLLGKVLVPERVANLEFGGPERTTLYITATSSLYVISVRKAGAPRPSDQGGK